MDIPLFLARETVAMAMSRSRDTSLKLLICSWTRFFRKCYGTVSIQTSIWWDSVYLSGFDWMLLHAGYSLIFLEQLKFKILPPNQRGYLKNQWINTEYLSIWKLTKNAWKKNVTCHCIGQNSRERVKVCKKLQK